MKSPFPKGDETEHALSINGVHAHAHLTLARHVKATFEPEYILKSLLNT